MGTRDNILSRLRLTSFLEDIDPDSIDGGYEVEEESDEDLEDEEDEDLEEVVPEDTVELPDSLNTLPTAD